MGFRRKTREAAPREYVFGEHDAVRSPRLDALCARVAEAGLGYAPDPDCVPYGMLATRKSSATVTAVGAQQSSTPSRP